MERFVIVMPVDTSAYLLPCDDGDNAAADFGFHCRQNSQSVKGTLNFKHDFVKHGWLSSPFSASIAQIGE